MVALWSAVNIVAGSPGSMGTRGMVSFGAIVGFCLDVAKSGIGSFLHAVNPTNTIKNRKKAAAYRIAFCSHPCFGGGLDGSA